jgi:hypothetical protein
LEASFTRKIIHNTCKQLPFRNLHPNYPEMYLLWAPVSLVSETHAHKTCMARSKFDFGLRDNFAGESIFPRKVD